MQTLTFAGSLIYINDHLVQMDANLSYKARLLIKKEMLTLRWFVIAWYDSVHTDPIFVLAVFSAVLDRLFLSSSCLFCQYQ